jgi:hypothetical protein
MDTVNARIINILDRLAHASTNDQDALQTVYGLRRVAKNQLPSVLLSFDASQSASQKRLKKKLDTVSAQLATQQEINHRLTEDYARLLDNIAQPHNAADDYPYAEVMAIIRDKFGKQNGALTLWADYSVKLHLFDANSPVLTASRLQGWRVVGMYPAWAVNQLLAMPIATRTVHHWSVNDIDYLCQLHLTDPFKTDEILAAECATQFDCEINTNSIKSKFNILRKKGRIPLLRPCRT